uniref:fimbria/pilus outer membrane usher protein n=1 Tax=Serratia marcescens TaxID=615 RepID=UPI002AA0E01C
VSYGLNYTFNQNGYDSNGNRSSIRDHIVAFNVSVPLSKWLPGSYATYNMNASRNGATSNNLGLSGTALPDNNLNYSISQAIPAGTWGRTAIFRRTTKAPSPSGTWDMATIAIANR